MSVALLIYYLLSTVSHNYSTIYLIINGNFIICIMVGDTNQVIQNYKLLQ